MVAGVIATLDSDMGIALSPVMYSGISSSVSSSAVSGYVKATHQEKRDLQVLNEQFEDYTKAVRHHEAEHRKLENEIRSIRNEWSAMSSTERAERMDQYEATEKQWYAAATQRDEARAEIARLQAKIDIYQALWNQRLADKGRLDQFRAEKAEAESKLLTVISEYEKLQARHREFKAQNSNLFNELDQLSLELAAETRSRYDAVRQLESRRRTVEIHKRANMVEKRYLTALLAFSPDANAAELRLQVDRLVAEIAEEYRLIAEHYEAEVNSWYRLKIEEANRLSADVRVTGGYQKWFDDLTLKKDNYLRMIAEYKTKNAALKSEYNGLYAQLQAYSNGDEVVVTRELSSIQSRYAELTREFQQIMNTKLAMDAEIVVYRKLIEGNLIVQEKNSGEHRVVATRTLFDKKSTGNVSISEANITGTFIVLANKSLSIDESIGGYTITRVIDGDRTIAFTLPPNTVLYAGKTLKIAARGHSGSLVNEAVTSWGVGFNIMTTLTDTYGAVKATFEQRTENVEDTGYLED